MLSRIVLFQLYLLFILFSCSPMVDEETSLENGVEGDNDIDDDNNNGTDNENKPDVENEVIPEKNTILFGIGYQNCYNYICDLVYMKLVSDEWYSNPIIRAFTGFSYPNLIETIWGTNINHIYLAGRFWKLAGWSEYPELLLYYNVGDAWILEDDISEPLLEAFSISGNNMDDIYMIANVSIRTDRKTNKWLYYNVYHFNGIIWEKLLQGRENSALFQIWIDQSGELFAVGTQWYSDGHNKLLILNYKDLIWSEMLYDRIDECMVSYIWGSSPDNIFMGGYKSTNTNWSPCVIHYNGIDIESISIPEYPGLAVQIKKILGINQKKVYFAFSSQEVIVKIFLYDGEKFIDTNFPLNLDDYTYGLEDMWVSPGGDVYVVGPYKGVMHYDGETWKRIPGPWLWKIYGFADQGTAGDMIGEEE